MLPGFFRSTVGLETIGGAAISVALTLYAGQRVGAPVILQILFAGWVALPYLGIAAGWSIAKRDLTRRALAVITPMVAIVSVAVYAAVALGSARPKTAVFVLVAPASLAVIAVAVGTAAALSERSAEHKGH